MAQYLQVVYEIFEHEPDVMQNMISIGMRMAEHLVLPPEIDSLEKGLIAMEVSWRTNTRNTPPAIWSVKKLTATSFICTCSSPMPIDQEYGTVYGFVRKFARGQACNVAYENLADRDDPDKEEVLFRVTIG
ncbi:MAG: hypothetical protein IAE80_09050 [Anaerolinea sp.]|nr:hypothetical protein [Anaerolinea sp.]